MRDMDRKTGIIEKRFQSLSNYINIKIIMVKVATSSRGRREARQSGRVKSKMF
jgi:hypothetical protein